MNNFIGNIEDYLPVGAKNARSSRELQRMLELSERELRRLVERRRFDGVEILANKRGLFLPAEGNEGRIERLQHVRLTKSRIRGQLRAIKPTLDALERMEGQLTIDDQNKEQESKEGETNG